MVVHPKPIQGVGAGTESTERDRTSAFRASAKNSMSAERGAAEVAADLRRFASLIFWAVDVISAAGGGSPADTCNEAADLLDALAADNERLRAGFEDRGQDLAYFRQQLRDVNAALDTWERVPQNGVSARWCVEDVAKAVGR